MKQLNIILLCLLISGTALAQEEEVLQHFDAGTAMLIDGQFSDALAQFELAEAMGWSSTELFYNMALTHHRMDRLGEAIRYLEKARHLSPDDAKVLHSLSVMTSRRVDSFSELPEPFWRKAHAWTVRAFPITPSFWIGLLAYLTLIGLLVVKHILFLEGEWFRRSRALAAVIGGALIVHALASSAWPPFDERAVILVDSISLLEQPDSLGTEVLEVHEGLIVKKGNRTSEWTFVQIPNGGRGWVPSASLGDI